VLNGAASPCHRLVADWPSIPDRSGGINQMTVFEMINTILHCLSDCVLAYFARSCKCCCELGLCLVSNAQTKFTAMFTGPRKIGQHAVRQTTQNGDNYLKEGHLIE